MLGLQEFPSSWSNFFLLVGTGSATLAGLVFVALTINLRGVATDATHRFRAINMLTGFTSVFLLSALALIPQQPDLAVGIEWLVVSVVAAAINTNGYVQAFRLRSSLYALSLFRIIGGSLCYLAQIVGSILLLLGVTTGLFVVAFAIVINVFFFVTGAWLLIFGSLETSENPRDVA